MKEINSQIKSVAIIGAGASGLISAAAFKAEKYFENIRLFERREEGGGTWLYDPKPGSLPIKPGSLPPDVDPPLAIPESLPATTAPSSQERFLKTPIYDSLTTNVPALAMSFSDLPFPSGPFVPYYIPRRYLESYISFHQLDPFISFGTTVEDISKTPDFRPGQERWKLTLRKHNFALGVDEWWEEEFDAVILANGHYTVPYVPAVKGLEEYEKLFPGKVTHSKTYRSPQPYKGKKVLVIGNSASGHDVTQDLVTTAHLPVYQSRHSTTPWDDNKSSHISWKPVITEFLSTGRILFSDGTHLDDIDHIFYCTGYLPSYPFWNSKINGRELWSYEKKHIINGYQHTFFRDFRTLAIVGLPKTLTFRGFEYQAVALARLFSGRNAHALPSVEDMERWEKEREKEKREKGGKFHDQKFDNEERWEWLEYLYKLAGLRGFNGEGRNPPVLGPEILWALEHQRKYPLPGKGKDSEVAGKAEAEDKVETECKDGNAEEDFAQEMPKKTGDTWVLVNRKGQWV